MRRIALVFLVLACDATGPGGSVPSGLWGGVEAGFIVDDTSGHAHIGCTAGDVRGPIVVDGSGRFDVPGRYDLHLYPVARRDPSDTLASRPARFQGRVFGKVLTLTVVFTDTALVLGPVTLVHGREPTMANCPICRPR